MNALLLILHLIPISTPPSNDHNSAVGSAPSFDTSGPKKNAILETYHTTILSHESILHLKSVKTCQKF